MDTKYLLNAFAIILLFMTSSPSMMNEGAFLPFFFLPRRLLISFQVAFGSPLTSSNFFKLYACFACLIIYFRFLRYDTYNWCFCSSSSSGSFIFLWFFLTTLTASRQALNSLCFLFDAAIIPGVIQGLKGSSRADPDDGSILQVSSIAEINSLRKPSKLLRLCRCLSAISCAQSLRTEVLTVKLIEFITWGRSAIVIICGVSNLEIGRVGCADNREMMRYTLKDSAG